MYIVMHCGGLPFNGQTITESSLGGSETAAYYMAKELTAVGHTVIIFTNSQATGKFDGVKYEWVGEITEHAPLGERFMYYAENTPHDVCIIQRHPRAFERKLASKINLLWLHDLALHRTRAQMQAQLWNVDKILCVSEWHKEQVAEVYGLPKDFIAVVNNGIDLALFAQEKEFENRLIKGAPKLLYSSRPERGLVNLVKVGGIMERLLTEKPDAHLYVCGYENKTAQMAQFYDCLYARCDALPNVTNLGALTKQQLADTMRQCDALIYPTEFEEVSCITAMEAMAAGLPFIASAVAALPETCAGSGSILIPLHGEQADIAQFIITVKQQAERNAIVLPTHETYKVAQLAAAKKYTWANSAKAVMQTVADIFATVNKTSLAHHFMRHSDIPAFEALRLQADGTALADALLEEFQLGYKFYREDDYANHYAAYYQYEKDRGVNYGPEDVTGTMRFQSIANLVATLPPGARVLDYGCAHGHYTVALARLNPQLGFVGADLAQSNIDTAVKWAADEGLTNVEFVKVSSAEDLNYTSRPDDFNFIIAAEVVEHVGDPQKLIDRLATCLRDDISQLVITVPYGPWEAMGYRQHGYWRAHLHHFERADLTEMLGHHPDYKIVAAPAGVSQFGSPIGSYIVSFGKPSAPSGAIDYTRKFAQTMPDQTITCCMIVKDAEADILRCLNSVASFVQEFVIGIDGVTTDSTSSILAKFAEDNPLIAFNIFSMPSVMETGFAAARNSTIEKAAGDWILWLDSDEVLVDGRAMAVYARNSLYNGYAFRQHHLSLSPMQVIKIDLPCRLFRNRIGVKFFGAVHEHPEQELNKGLGPVSMMPTAAIVHHGYTEEDVRRKRFGRNINLLKRDRRELPDRLLGKFLWLRDLAQMCQYDIEDERMDVAVFMRRADEGIALWESLLASGNYRLVVDALPFYSSLVQIKGGGFEFGFKVAASKLNGGIHMENEPLIAGHFASKDHAQALMLALMGERVEHFDSRHF